MLPKINNTEKSLTVRADFPSQDSFVISAKSAQVTTSFKISTGLRTQIVMTAFQCACIQPDTGQQIKMLVQADSIPNRLHQRNRHIPVRFFPGLEWWDWGASAAGSTVVAGFNQGQAFEHHRPFPSVSGEPETDFTGSAAFKVFIESVESKLSGSDSPVFELEDNSSGLRQPANSSISSFS